jgi:hypothetical protein
MVFHPYDFGCLNFVVLDFSFLTSKSGPSNTAASNEWKHTLEELRSLKFCDVIYTGFDKRFPCSLIILFRTQLRAQVRKWV